MPQRPSALVALLLVLTAAPALALPPYQTLLEQLEAFRHHAGNVTLEGRMDYGPMGETPVQIRRVWGDPLTLSFGTTEFQVDSSDTDVDIVLRLLGAALSATDIIDAVGQLGRAVEPRIEGLMFLSDGTLVYVLGGALGARTTHIYVERDTYRLRGIDLPAPEGVYRIELSDYRLCNGWCPSWIVVYRGDSTLVDIRVDSST